MDLREVPKNDLLLTALQMYQISDTTKNLKSERNRTVFAEDFRTDDAPLLSTMCLKVIAENYKGRRINLELSRVQSRLFYDYIDPYLPIEKCINIEDENYWKRVFCLICKDKIAIKEKMSNKDTCWKELSINMKYVEVIETTPVEIWILDEMHKLSKLVSPYIKEIRIKKLQPLRESTFRKVAAEPSEGSEESEGNLGEEEENLGEIEEEEDMDDIQEEKDIYPVELCHHADLCVVKNLTFMHTLIVEFMPPELGIHYHTRFFNFSYVDMQNLASGISELPNLKAFIMRRSRMDCIKLSIILEAVKIIFVEHLEFFYCQLDDECGESLYEFLISTSTLKNLNLTGNYFRDSGIVYLADGIAHSPSSLTHLGLSNNPIENDAICKLTETLKSCEQLAYLTLSGVKVTKPGSICIAQLIKTNHNLEEVEVIAAPMEGFYIVDAMNENKNVQQLLCQGCGLTLEEEFKVELLLRRNRYIRQNPYIGDTTKTEEEINAFVSRIKNPLLLKALATIQSEKVCRNKLKGQAVEEEDIDKIKEEDESESESEEYKFLKEIDTEEIDYEADKFTRDELQDRITLFGQGNFNFFKKIRRRSRTVNI